MFMVIINHQGGPRDEDEWVHMAGQGFLWSYLLWLDDERFHVSHFLHWNIYKTEHWLGEMKNAETLFQSVFDRASKGTNAAWKKFLYGSSVGMVWSSVVFRSSVQESVNAHDWISVQGLVLYHKGNYTEAQSFFKKAIITNPNCDPSVRLVSNSFLLTSNLLLY